MDLAPVSHLLEPGNEQISSLPISLSHSGQFYNAHFRLSPKELSVGQFCNAHFRLSPKELSVELPFHLLPTLNGVSDECKTHLCFEFISHAILCILYPYSCKTHKISSKLGFVGLLMKSK